MKIINLSEHTRIELHNHMKKNIRKYYKGLKNGSLKYDFFVQTIFSKNPKPNWLKEYPQLEKDIEFKKNLIEYIKNEIEIYTRLEKESKLNSHVLSNHLNKKTSYSNTLTIKERQALKVLLYNHGYSLSIPIKFLTYTESHYIKEYILHGTPIPFEWEKVLNYIKKEPPSGSL